MCNMKVDDQQKKRRLQAAVVDQLAKEDGVDPRVLPAVVSTMFSA